MQVEDLERPPAQSPDSETHEASTQVLLLPGLDNSGPRHWQGHWEKLSRFSRVDFGAWDNPRLHLWVDALDRAIRERSGPLILAAHSLGCLATAWWAALRWTEDLRGKVRGALLVAPPDVDALDVDVRLRDFRPLPQHRLPFHTTLIASRDDSLLGFGRAKDIARLWGSDLVDAGRAGHINAESGLEEWPAGLRHLAALSGHNPNLLVSELGLRLALA